ncbi:uncharacterized protein LOC123471221 isoform X1 [Daphnia magna]|uniref:uncharacterized protein LOC123471221 isoform X1 n=2 Tax=Daphnia magna TaxID=35525 RepID=UPI001E1BC643|nr:uncharacterized protein LOC123471221 isoform X1 [Daphnia magna]XP_045028188.1 uncharacterized protein LOC123471221 isoform X1 [Daphnia magna]
MDVDKEVQRLESLSKDSQANMSEIIRIYYCIAKDASSAASSAVPILNKLAVHLLSPAVTSISKKHRLDAFSYILVANNLLDLDDVKDDLENGDVLMTNAPATAIRKLKAELGVTPASAIPTAAPATQTAAQALSAPLDKLQMTMRSSSYMDQAASHRDENRVAVEIKNQCKDMKNLNGMILYKLPLKATSPFSGAASIVRRFSFGEPSALANKTCKTILLMGATGSGKTTMINAMINYVLGVRWDDPFRFILVEEKETSQAFSQTREVTAYDIHYRNGFRIPYSLTIVDTPGFSDTEGIERDQEITSAVKQFFENRNGIQELDAVGFTVQSSLPRLTSSQTYIFNSVLSIFGKDIGENVRFLVTFADGGRPSVLAAIKEAKLPCLMDANKDPCYQSFNNRAVFVSNQTPDDRLSPMEWDNAMQNFHSFFAELSKMPIKSLQLTKEVLNSRESLHITIQGLEETIQAHLMKMEELRKIEEIIALHKDQVNANKNFDITVKVPKKKRIEVDTNQTALNCSKCEVTCHYPCNPNLWMGFCPVFWRSEEIFHTMSDMTILINDLINLFNQRNTIMAAVGTATAVSTDTSLLVRNIFTGRACKVCPGKCATTDHANEVTKWMNFQEEETRPLYDIRKKYDDAMEKTLSAEELKNALQGEVVQLKFEIIKAMDEITRCSNLLKEMALRGDPLSTPEYINLMIENENKEKKPGYLERIKCFEDLLRKAELTKDVTDGGDLVKKFKK